MSRYLERPPGVRLDQIERYIGHVKTFDGMFDTHLTARLPDGDDDFLTRYARGHELKYARILLDQGVNPQQPMLSYSGEGTLPERLALSERRSGELREAGFEVVRVKIEAAPWNRDVPQSAAEASELSAGCYFEHHVKLLLADDAEAEAVRRIGTRHAGHVSRNGRRVLSDSRHERFLTQRCRLVGRPEARRRLDALLDDLQRADHQVIEIEEEFVVHDDNLGLDRGWADA